MTSVAYQPVYFDIETFLTNTSTPHPSELDSFEYAVTYQYRDGDKLVTRHCPTLADMLTDLMTRRKRTYELIAHNGNKFDFHFLRRALIESFNLKPENAYIRNSVDHTGEATLKDETGDYLHESRVKSKTSLSMDFRIGRYKFKTTDTAPKFQASIKTLGKQLFHHHVIAKEDEKRQYDYTRWNIKGPVDLVAARKHGLSVYNGLSSEDWHYIDNDVNILREACEHYNTLFPSFDYSKRTLSLNILNEYKVNDLADLQLLSTLGKNHFSYTDYDFDKQNLFTYFHSFYKGGLNFYNDRTIASVVTDAVHLDLNSSYPTVMSTCAFPTYPVEAGANPVILPLDPAYFYMVKMSKLEFNRLLKCIPSHTIRKMFTKYFNTLDAFVYLLTPHISLLGKFIGSNLTSLKVLSFVKWETRPFGAKAVIDSNYAQKVHAKKAHWAKEEVYVTKVILNGIYGIPALRAYYNLFKIGDEGDYYNTINGFHNSERNIVFAGAVTSYALYNLLSPLTKDVRGVDQGFIYCDTDSLFLKKDYFKTIEYGLEFDDYKLGAWGVEHPDVLKIYVLNHKKYCYQYRNPDGSTDIEIHAGGVTAGTFTMATHNVPLEDIIAGEFHPGATIAVLKSVLTRTMVIALHNSTTRLNQGGAYPEYFSAEQERETIVDRMIARDIEDATENEGKADSLYYETPYSSFSVADLYPHELVPGTSDIRNLFRVYNKVKHVIDSQAS